MKVYKESNVVDETTMIPSAHRLVNPEPLGRARPTVEGFPFSWGRAMKRKPFYLNDNILDCPACHRMGPGEFFRQLYAAVKQREQNHVATHIRFILTRPYIRGWRWIRLAVFERDHYTCRYCGGRVAKPHCDHVIPLVRGGSSELDNLVTSCQPCNNQKHAKTPQEWLS